MKGEKYARVFVDEKLWNIVKSEAAKRGEDVKDYAAEVLEEKMIELGHEEEI